jgi:hypothetical protein
MEKLDEREILFKMNEAIESAKKGDDTKLTQMDISMAKRYIATFFENKSCYIGGPINFYNPNGTMYIFSEKNIDLVCYLTCEDSLEIAYSAMNDKINNLWRERYLRTINTIGNYESRKYMDFCKECVGLKIPKKFASGLFIIYLEFCEGLKFRK